MYFMDPRVAFHEQKRLGTFNFPHEEEPKTNQLETFLFITSTCPRRPVVSLFNVGAKQVGRASCSQRLVFFGPRMGRSGESGRNFVRSGYSCIERIHWALLFKV